MPSTDYQTSLVFVKPSLVLVCLFVCLCFCLFGTIARCPLSLPVPLTPKHPLPSSFSFCRTEAAVLLLKFVLQFDFFLLLFICLLVCLLPFHLGLSIGLLLQNESP